MAYSGIDHLVGYSVQLSKNNFDDKLFGFAQVRNTGSSFTATTVLIDVENFSTGYLLEDTHSLAF